MPVDRPSPFAAVFIVVSAILGPVAEPVYGQDSEWWSGLESLPGGVHMLVADSLYAVEGVDVRTIGISMTLGGHEIEGETFRGLHSYRYRYLYWPRQEGDLCGVSEMTILLRSVIRMPVLTSVESLDDDLRELWSEYEENLRLHEEGHRDIARKFMIRFRDLALELVPGPCDSLGDRIIKLRDQIVAETRAADRSYDDETGHGRTQGAMWPPRRGF